MPKLKIYTLPEFAELELPPKRYLIDPFLPERGLIEIYSKPGVGKTTFALSLAMAVALGKSFLKWNVSKAKNVLYMEGKMVPEDILERTSATAQFFGRDISEVDNFRIINRDVNNGILPDIGEHDGQIRTWTTEKISIKIEKARKLGKSLFGQLQLIRSDLHTCFLSHEIHENPETLLRINCIHSCNKIGKGSSEHFNAISLIQTFGWKKGARGIASQH